MIRSRTDNGIKNRWNTTLKRRLQQNAESAVKRLKGATEGLVSVCTIDCVPEGVEALLALEAPPEPE